MTERGLKNINVFYSTFTNVFLFLSRFLPFLTFFIFFWNVFYIYGISSNNNNNSYNDYNNDDKEIHRPRLVAVTPLVSR